MTPDFYRYVWKPLSRAELGADAFVTVVWTDGASLRCYALWLAENTLGLGIEPKTREAMIDPADLPNPFALRSVSVGPDGELAMDWLINGSSLRTTAHPGWVIERGCESSVSSAWAAIALASAALTALVRKAAPTTEASSWPPRLRT